MARRLLDTATKLALRGEASVQEILLSADIRPENQGMFQAELIAYQLFLLDVIVNRTFGEDARPVRKRMREQFADLAVQAVRKAGGEPSPPEEYVAFLEDRFEEYTPALRRSIESQGAPKWDALALPDAVINNVAESIAGDPLPTTALHFQWLSVFKEIPDALEKYEIVAEA